MSTAFLKFEELETRILRTVDLVKTTRHEKENLEKELVSARLDISRLENELQELRRERDLVKNRVETMLKSLSELTEDADVQSEVASNRR